MLETLDLKLKLSREEYRRQIDLLGGDLQRLQRAAYENGIPAIIIFEGWDAAGKGDAISHLVQNMDPRGFQVHVTRQRTEEEALRPFLWRFWQRLPGKGAISIFDRSWYHLITLERLRGDRGVEAWERALEEIRDFERQLADDGVMLLKFWLHISKKEQKRRLKAWAKDPHQRWRVQEQKDNRPGGYEEVCGLLEAIFARTNVHRSPWAPIESEDDSFRRVKILREVSQSLRRALEERGVKIEPLANGGNGEEEAAAAPASQASRASRASKTSQDSKASHASKASKAGSKAVAAIPAKSVSVIGKDPLRKPPEIPRDSPLARADLTLTLDRETYEKEIHENQERLRELGFKCFMERKAAVMLFEGWDAAGKGGAIKRLTQELDPRGYTVIPIAAPSAEDKAHHYLWRFWRRIPKDGHLAIFDRSWYGRVLVERVEGFCSTDAWRRAYQEINEFEHALAGHGVVLVKFWLHLSPREQLARFRRREEIAEKNYKITEEDWRNRAKWPQYLEAVSDMLRQTSTAYAPWTIVEAEDKLWARAKVLKTAVAALEEGFARGKGPKKPKK